MSANIKIALIVLIGVGACLLSILSSQYFRKMDSNNQLLLSQIDKASERTEYIRILSKTFIQYADRTSWDQISQSMESVRLNLQTAAMGHWKEETEALSQSLDDYQHILTQLYEPAVRLKAEKKALQEIGLTFSNEVEEKIIKPYRKDESLRIYKGEPIDPFKARAKEAAYDLVALHIKQQLILHELILSSDLKAYKEKKQYIATALAKHKAQLRYMAVLMGEDPSIQSILDPMDQKLESLLDHEQAIIENFAALEKLDSRLITAGDRLLSKARELSAKISSDTLQASRLNSILNWTLLLGILGGLTVLGVLLARNIIQFLEDLKTAQRTTKESEEKYRSLLENIPQKIFYKDKNSRYISCNIQYAKDLNITPEQIIGKTDYDFHPKEFAEKYIADDKRVLASGNTEFVEEEYFQNGNKLIVNTLKAPVKDEQGNTVGIFGTFWDITEQKHVQNALSESEEKMRLIIESSPIGIRITQDGKYMYVNPSFVKIFGHENSDEIVGRPIEELYAYEDRESILKKHWDRLAGNKGISSYEVKGLRKSGEPFDIEVWSTSVDYDGRPAVLGFITDISETKELRAQLHQAQRVEAIGTLAGGIAHDFNNILGAIIGYTELAGLDIPKSSPASNNLLEVLKACERAKDVVSQILAFSRQTELKDKPIKLAPVIKEGLKLLRASLPTTIEIRANIEDDTGTVVVGPSQIHQVLMNLCTNAAHAMQETGGVLEVTLLATELDSEAAAAIQNLKPGPYVSLAVSDSGYGISSELKDRIFEPYFTTKEKGVGTGLGLSVVHGIVARHSGAISFNTDPGKGTTFYVYLPRFKDQAEETFEPVEEPPTGKEHILFVDDEENLVQVVQQMLEHLGYKVTAKTSPIEALETFKSKPEIFDLVITDQTMPNMTGEKLAKKFIQIRPKIPIILCSGFSGIMSESKAIAIGIKAYVIKPFLMMDLAKKVREVLDQIVGEERPSNFSIDNGK
ncbi:PAS domain S-box protein [Thermodesulfobacteriota bacterium]